MQACFPHASVDAHHLDTATSIIDEAQLEVLMTEVRHMAQRFARRLMRPQDAEDLAQDVVLTCLVSIREGTWNGRVARLPVIVAHLVRCRAIDRGRLRQHAAERERDFAAEELEACRSWMAPDLALEERELDELRERALEELSPACRLAYLLVREEGLSYREVARLLGVSRGGVSKLVVTAQHRLRRQLTRRGIAAPRWRRRRTLG